MVALRVYQPPVAISEIHSKSLMRIFLKNAVRTSWLTMTIFVQNDPYEWSLVFGKDQDGNM